jgi:two-component system phosphate regulon sensor histidine kinase PhoR
LSSLTPLAETSDVALALDAATDAPPISGDEDQLRQVFTNLIENSIKYGGAGQQTAITLRIIDRDPVLRVPAVQVQVIDRGAGIDAIHLPRLTERFYRVDNHRSRELGGTGLGLAIVKHIVNRHRGRFRIDSALGKGTTCTVVLPQ